MTDSKRLFNGAAIFLAGLSNENELARICPDEFKKPNPWSDLAIEFYRNKGGRISHWKFKSNDYLERKDQVSHFKALMASIGGISYDDKIAVAGWMLSEMLTEVPKYIEQYAAAGKWYLEYDVADGSWRIETYRVILNAGDEGEAVEMAKSQWSAIKKTEYSFNPRVVYRIEL